MPPNSITNGITYNAQITVYDQFNVASEISDKVLFVCFLTPTFTIGNLTNNQMLRDSQYQIDINYSQVTGELLDYYIVNLMDFSGNIIRKSNSLYPAIDGMSYRLMSLLDNNSYQIQINGITVNGMIIETPQILFTVEYINPSLFSQISLENIPDEGSIKIESNFVSVEGISNPDPPIYINNQEIDLTNPNHWVKFNKGFRIDRDFFILIKCRNINLNKEFFVLSDGTNEISLRKMFGNFEGYNNVQNYITLLAKNQTLTYRLTSNLIDEFEKDDEILIIIKRINNLYYINIT